jgi:SAM-dependent methyltransferase
MADRDPASTPEQLRIQRLNTLWRVSGPAPEARSVPYRLVYALRSMAARLLRPQETFNAAVVESLNDLTQSINRLTRHVAQIEPNAKRVEAGFATLEELRTAVGVLQQTTQTLRHRLATAAVAPSAAAGTGAAPGPMDGLKSDTYVVFENAFRGDPAVIRSRLAEYIPIFAGTSGVLDVGCGRGEFLDLLREARIPARGVDVNASMVQVCRDQGLDAVSVDALAALRAAPPGSLGGLFAAQVVEHFEPAYLIAFLSAAFDALRPGAPLVLETINPACWFAFFESYLRDITHARALHPDTLKYLVVAAGFQRVDVSYRVPYPESDKLQMVPEAPAVQHSINVVNQNLERLNGLLFSSLDYAVIAYRP